MQLIKQISKFPLKVSFLFFYLLRVLLSSSYLLIVTSSCQEPQLKSEGLEEWCGEPITADKEKAGMLKK